MTVENRVIVLNGAEFTLGQKYRDTLLDLEGVATGGCSYVTGCDQLLLAAKDKNGMPFTQWVDVTRIEGVDVEQRDGGPEPNIPPRHPA